MNEPPPPARFPTTHWSRVARAGDRPTPEARAALAELCGAYWYPIYALIRRKGHDPDAALDLTQDYFARLLEKGTVAAADPAKGRFRSFLLADCGFFLADRRDRDRALKRGGGRPRRSRSTPATPRAATSASRPTRPDARAALRARPGPWPCSTRVLRRSWQRHYADTGRRRARSAGSSRWYRPAPTRPRTPTLAGRAGH